MAIYEYDCKNCHHKFEIIRRKPRKTKTCPECGEQAEKVDISRTAFHLKDGGVGWADKGYSNN